MNRQELTNLFCTILDTHEHLERLTLHIADENVKLQMYLNKLPESQQPGGENCNPALEHRKARLTDEYYMIRRVNIRMNKVIEQMKEILDDN